MKTQWTKRLANCKNLSNVLKYDPTNIITNWVKENLPNISETYPSGSVEMTLGKPLEINNRFIKTLRRTKSEEFRFEKDSVWWRMMKKSNTVS